ncbi:MAG TPA: hypothetical protein VIF09_21585 [Polyangiaceae bacterium]
MAPARLPRYRADAWAGGFAVASPVYTRSISAVDGTVVAATERIYRLRPGATGFQTREPPEGMGDVVAVAVEPRRPGREQRIAVATIHELHLYGAEGVASVAFPEDHGEVVDLLWGPMLYTPPGWAPDPPGEPIDVLYVRCANVLLQLVPDGGPSGTLMQLAGPVASASALAADHAGGFAFACLDEEDWQVEVWTLAEREPQLWHCRRLDAPTFFTEVRLAIAGKALAVSFGFEGVWLTRDCKEHPFTELEELRGSLDPHDRCSAAAIAFEGSADDAALFAAVRDTMTIQHIVRVDAEGRARRIAEIEVAGNDGERLLLPPVRALAWDATRRTVWSAAGWAGIMCSTAPGAPSWLPATAAS